jgi:PGF-CTERM protein
MVLSMVAMTATLPGAAVAQTTVDANFQDQALGSDGVVVVGDVATNETAGEEYRAVVTYQSGGNTVVAGDEIIGENFGPENVAVTIDDYGGFPGEYTAHIVDSNTVNTGEAVGNGAGFGSDAIEFSSSSATVFDLGFNGGVSITQDQYQGTIYHPNPPANEIDVSSQVGTGSADDVQYAIAIHEVNSDGTLGSPINAAGQDPKIGSFDGTIETSRQLETGEEVAAMLHYYDSGASTGLGDTVPVSSADNGGSFTTATSDTYNVELYTALETEVVPGVQGDNDFVSTIGLSHEDGTNDITTVYLNYDDGQSTPTIDHTTIDDVTLAGDTVGAVGVESLNSYGDDTLEINIAASDQFAPTDENGNLVIRTDGVNIDGAGNYSLGGYLEGPGIDPEAGDYRINGGSLVFDDQRLGQLGADGTVTAINVTTNQESTLIVTYEDGGNLVVAGVAGADNLNNEDVTVAVEDTGGFPGDYTAHLVADEDLSSGYSNGDIVSADTASAIFSQDTAVVGEATDVTLAEQGLGDDGEVFVETFGSGDSTIAITYEDGGETILAGATNGSDDQAFLNVAVEDAGGFPGEHTAHVLENTDGVGIGESVTNTALASQVAADTSVVYNANVTVTDSDNQDTAGDVVTVDSSDLQPESQSDYVIVIHEATEGLPVLGSSNTLTGAQDQVEIGIDPLIGDTDVVAMLHYEDGGSAGVPIAQAGSEGPVPVQDTATVTLDQPDDADSKLALDGHVFWEGQDIHVGGFDVNEFVTLKERSGDGSIETQRAGEEGAVSFDSENLDGYYLLQTGDESYGVFEVTKQEINFDFEEATAEQGSSTGITVTEDNRGELVDVEISGEYDGENLDAETLEEIFETVDEDEDRDTVTVTDVGVNSPISAEFGTDRELGDYEFSIHISDTTASDTAAIEVTERADGEVHFISTPYEEQRGNVAKFTLNVQDYDEDLYVNFGDQEAVAFEQVLEITDVQELGDKDELTLTLNTAMHPENPDAWDVEQDGVDVDIHDTIQSLPQGPYLESAQYPLDVAEGYDDGAQELVNPLDVSVFKLADHQPIWESPVTVLTAPSDTIDTPDDYDEEIVTETDTIAKGDEMLIRVEAESVYGFVEKGDNVGPAALNEGDTIDGAIDNMQVKIEGTDDRLNVDTVEEVGTWDDSQLVGTIVSADQEAGEFVVLLDVEGDLSLNSDFDVIVEMSEASSFYDDWEETRTSYAFEERNLEWDDSAAEAPTIANAGLTGTTNVAAGTEIASTARADGVFVERTESIVDDDGSFNAPYDFSEETAGIEFDLTATDLTDETNEDQITSTLVEPEADDFALSVDFGQDTYEIDQGDSVDIDVTAVAGADGLDADDVALSLNGEELASDTVTADAGASDDATFTLDTNAEDFPEGDHDLEVTLLDASDEATLTIVVEDDENGDEETNGDEDNGDEEMNGDENGMENGDENGSEEPTDDDQPGFGLMVAVLSLLGAALLARRHN